MDATCHRWVSGGTPSSQPWVESNIWLVKSLGVISSSRPVWISSRLEHTSAVDYERAIGDAAAAGGRWIISLDDALRAKLRAHDAAALETWRRLSIYVKFSEAHAAWRALAPYGNVGILLDSASKQLDQIDEYLKLATRRQVPYQFITRSELNNGGIAKFRAVVATELDPPSAAEHKVLQDFAENGGIVFAGPSSGWNSEDGAVRRYRGGRAAWWSTKSRSRIDSARSQGDALGR